MRLHLFVYEEAAYVFSQGQEYSLDPSDIVFQRQVDDFIERYEEEKKRWKRKFQRTERKSLSTPKPSPDG